MLRRVLPIIVYLTCAAGSIAAQQRTTRVQTPQEPMAVAADLLARLRLTVPPLVSTFERRPFRYWAAEWAEATRLRLAARERALLYPQGRTARAPEGQAALLTGVEVERELGRPGAGVAAAAGAGRQPGAAGLAGADTVNYLPPLVARADTGRLKLPGVMGQYADLGMEVRGRGELGGQWNRYEPCDPSLGVDCNMSLFPRLTPDVLFAVAIGGTISDRVHVNVDYDQAREFDAANNLNVYYQGLPDEVLQRIEVGDVSIRLPSSRFLTSGIPAGNFGFMASGQLGPMDFQTVFAQQKGDVTTREFKLGGTGQDGLVQDAELVLDDADYAKGQFFFLVEPRRLVEQPHVDVLALRPTDAEAAFRPATGGTIQLYRDERISPSSVQQSAQLGYFLANATPPGGGTRHSGTFRRLIQDQDYYIHSSGLWIMLRSPLRADEALAVSYMTETGDTVGTYNAEQVPAGVVPELLLLRGAATTHQPGSPTWPMELHQVYRLDGSSDLDPASIEMSVTLGEAAGGLRFRTINGQQVSFLRLFGLDEDAPVDRLDLAQVFQPGRNQGDAVQQPIGGTFIVFPTLQPFLEPPPVASAGLSADAAKQALGGDANAAIYQDADPVRRETTTRFRLSFKYRVAVQGVVSSFNLGAFGIREASERLTLGNLELRRDVDYTIDYDIGQVQLLDPQALFGANPGAQLRATWEQKPLFQLAPTSVFGLNTRFQLADRGELNFVGLYQVEKSLMSRPQLGTEPGSIFLGGTSGRFDLGGALVKRALSALPGLEYNGETSLRLTGELAFSTPNPNRQGVAYVDDFESSDEIRIEPRRNLWKLGSRPQSLLGGAGVLPGILDEYSAAPLVWQHDYMADGRVTGALLPSLIDRDINIAGTERLENLLYLRFGYPRGQVPPLPPREPTRWRSMTQVLSTTGIDLSRSEYLEFYVRTGDENGQLALVLDLGVVAEDAFYVDSLGRTSGNYPDDNKPWGLGIADEEASLVRREVWSDALDRRGLWNQSCQGSPTLTYEFGDPSANCTRGNGARDSEDLNGDGIVTMDDGQYYRYVVPLDGSSEYLARDRDQNGTGTPFRLYRIPLRGPGAIAVNGATEATWRFVRHLRLTVAGEAESGPRSLALARMRIVGSRWAKRDITGVVRGLLDGQPGAGSTGTQVRVGPVSQLTDGLQYRPPAGVNTRTQDPHSQLSTTGVEYNEKSLRIAYDALEPGERAEAYFHYAQQPRNFLTYRQLRLWAVARQGQWGVPEGERLLIKLGTDPNNYYLYQTRLQPATGDRPVTDADWTPEVVIEFQRWLELRAEAERRLVERGDQSSRLDTVWSADSAYALVYEGRARAPNLAAVRELSFAIFNGGLASSSGEVWLDDLRLGAAESRPGTAAALGLDLAAGDFMSASLQFARRSDVFRQLNQDPSYVGAADLSVSADARLDRFLPASWGLELPVSISHVQSAQEPTFLSQSDVAAEQLSGLRETGSGSTRVGVRLRKVTPTANPVLGAIVDGTTVSLGYTKAHSSAITSRSESGGLDLNLTYQRDVAEKSVDVLPGFVETGLRALVPEAVERSEAFNRLVGSRLRWTPDMVGFSAGYGNQLSRSFMYSRILDLPDDSAVVPIESPQRALRTQATLSLQPFRDLDATFSLSSNRDLLEPERAVPGAVARGALERARGGVAGLDLGWETSRSLASHFSWRPVITDWLRLAWTWDNNFMTGRDASYLEYTVAGADTTAELQRRFEAERRTTTRIQFRPADFFKAWLGAPDSSASGAGPLLRRQLARLQPVELNWSGSMGSAFERELALPGTGYQLGWGALDRFRFSGADTAVRARERNEFRATGGIQLWRNALLTLSYRSTETLSFDARGGRNESRELAWPGGTLTLRSLPLGSWFSTASASMGVERMERSSIIGTGTPQERGSSGIDLVPRFSLGIGRGRAPIMLSYDGRFNLGDSYEPTGRAEDFTSMHNVMVTSVVQLPESMRRQFTQPLNVTLSFSQNGQRRCRVLGAAGGTDCVAYVDFVTRSGSLRLDTSTSDLRFGASIDYTSRDTYVGLRNGTNQFQLMLFGEFNFTAGELPAGMGGLR